MKRIVSILLVVLAVSFVVYLTLKEKSPDRVSAKVVRIMDPIEANNLHIPVADRMGFFRDEGLNVEMSHTSAGKFAMDAVNAGGVDYGVVVDMNVAHTLFVSNDVSILSEIAEPTRAIKILGRRDHGVTEAKDLVGKKLGVLFGVNIHLFVLRYLEDHGIDPQQVELVNLKPQDAVVAFHRGDLDAVITWQPHVYRLQSELGDRVVVLTDDNEKYWTYKMILVAKKSYLENNGEEAIKILRALVRADDFIKSNTPKAQEILADILNLSVEEVKSFYDEIHFEVQISPRLLPMLRTEVDWLQDTLLNGKEPVTKDLRSVISNKLSTVKRSAFKIEGN